MDKTDYRIIELLKQNSRTPNSSIAKKVNLTEGAVRRRIRRLVKDNTIKRFTIETKENRIEAIVLIKTQTRRGDVLMRIREHADRLFETAGEYDAAAHLAGESIQEINSRVDRLRTVDGVISTLTLMKIADEQNSKA